MRNIIKGTACFLAICILLCGTFACADQHMELSCVSADQPGAFISFDLYGQEGAVYLLSSLFPDHVYRFRSDESFSVSGLNDCLPLRAGMAAAVDRTLGDGFMQWLGEKLSAPEYDSWSGELFEKASSMRYAEFSLDELITFLDPQSAPQDPDTPASGLIRSQAYSLVRDLRDSGMTVLVRSFDEGKYLSADVRSGDDTVMTVSADCTETGAKRLLIIHREEGRYYFRDIKIRYDDESFTASSTLRSGDTSSGMAAEGNVTLFTETFSGKNGPDQSFGFEWTFTSPSLSDSTAVTGTVTGGESGQARLDAVLCIGDASREVIRISASAEPLVRQVSFTDKIEVTEQDETESGKMMISAAAGLMLFASEIMPSLPVSYQKIVWNLLAQ